MLIERNATKSKLAALDRNEERNASTLSVAPRQLTITPGVSTRALRFPKFATITKGPDAAHLFARRDTHAEGVTGDEVKAFTRYVETDGGSTEPILKKDAQLAHPRFTSLDGVGALSRRAPATVDEIELRLERMRPRQVLLASERASLRERLKRCGEIRRVCRQTAARRTSWSHVLHPRLANPRFHE